MPPIAVHASPHPLAATLARRIAALAHHVAPGVELDLGVRPNPDGPSVEVGGLEVVGHPALSHGAAPESIGRGGLALVDDATPDPMDPPDWLLEAALLRALAPRHLLFLCVANSARSQMAEGVARALAPAGVRVSSAGSEPSRVRPQAVAALSEIGIDIGAQWSKGVDEVERPVDAVVTLCAEEVCPVWLESSWRLHWGLPDPAGAGATPEQEMHAFRGVRDELRRRLAVVFAP